MPLSGDGKLGFCEILALIGKSGMGGALTVAALNHPKSCQRTTSGRIIWAWNTPRGDDRHLFAGLCRAL